MWLRISFNNIVFNPFDCVLLTIILFALIFLYKWKRGKMPFPWMLSVHILLYLFSMIVVGLVRHELFPLIAVGASTFFGMYAFGAGGDDHTSSSFFGDLSDFPAEPGEEIHSQPSPGVGQRLPGSLEISSPGISQEVIWGALEEAAPEQEAAPPAPLSVEEEEEKELLTKREKVKFEIRTLLQIGYNKRARNEKEINRLFQDIDIDSERNATFLKELLDHLRGLRQPWGDGGTSGQPKKFSNIEVQELLRWISEKRGN